jgi:hypothetical protein
MVLGFASLYPTYKISDRAKYRKRFYFQNLTVLGFASRYPTYKISDRANS